MRVTVRSSATGEPRHRGEGLLKLRGACSRTGKGTQDARTLAVLRTVLPVRRCFCPQTSACRKSGRIRGKKSACPNAVTHSAGCLFSGSLQRILLLRGWLQLIAKCVSGNTGLSRAVHVQEDSHVQSLLTGKLSVTSSKRAEYNMPV